MDAHSPEPRIERISSVLDRTGLSRSALYAAIADGDFPQPLKLGARAMGFLSSEIDALTCPLPDPAI